MCMYYALVDFHVSNATTMQNYFHISDLYPCVFYIQVIAKYPCSSIGTNFAYGIA